MTLGRGNAGSLVNGLSQDAKPGGDPNNKEQTMKVTCIRPTIGQDKEGRKVHLEKGQSYDLLKTSGELLVRIGKAKLAEATAKPVRAGA